MKKHVRTVGNVFGAREFFWRMAYPANARNKDHSDGCETRYVLRVVTRAARHQFSRQAKLFCRLGDESPNPLISRRRNVYVNLFEVKGRAARLSNTVGFV